MAFTGVFASPLFNFLCGAGVALMALAHQSGGSARVWTSSAGMVSMRWHAGFLTGTCLMLCLILMCRKSRSFLWPLSLFILYGVFLAVVLSAEHAQG